MRNDYIEKLIADGHLVFSKEHYYKHHLARTYQECKEIGLDHLDLNFSSWNTDWVEEVMAEVEKAGIVEIYISNRSTGMMEELEMMEQNGWKYNGVTRIRENAYDDKEKHAIHLKKEAN